MVTESTMNLMNTLALAVGSYGLTRLRLALHIFVDLARCSWLGYLLMIYE